MNEWKGKDAAPEATVQRITALLSEVGFELEETVFPRDVSLCHSARVSLKGPAGRLIGANGKGTTSVFCAASAHAEMIERLQNIMFTSAPAPHDPFLRELLPPEGWPMSYDVRGADQPMCIERLKKRVETTVSAPPGIAPRAIVDALLTDLTSDLLKGQFLTWPLYSVREHKYVHLPTDLIKYFTLSNGMAAGNTLEEAIVQACCEIFERYAESVSLKTRVSPPDIPREVLSAFPLVERIVSQIEASGPYRVLVKDCSLDMRLPVVCGVIVNISTQRFGIKFGAHPDMGIALERVFSESLQGNTLERFTSAGDVLFDDSATKSRVNLWNLLKTGAGSFPASLFLSKPDYAFVPWPDVKDMDNATLMYELIDKLSEMSEDVFIQDVSFLGFPSVMVYAPGISEVMPVDALHLKEQKLRFDAQRIFQRLADASDADVERLLLLAKIKRNATLENTIAAMSGLGFTRTMPGAPFEAQFMWAACLYRLERLPEAIDALRAILPHLGQFDGDHVSYVKAVHKYMCAKQSGLDEGDTLSVLKSLCPEHIVERVAQDFRDPQKVLSRLYPQCNGFDCASCAHEDCVYGAVRDVYIRLTKISYEKNVGKKRLHTLFEEWG